MKKLLLYLPAIVFTILYGLLFIAGFGATSTVAFWIGLFILSGYLLSKKVLWGGFIGFIPGVHLIFMSTKATGQVIDIEFPMGIVIIFYYIILLVLFIKRKI